MTLLPRFSKIFACLLLVSSLLFLVSSSAYAAPDPPNPEPCKYPLGTDKLTDNYVTNDQGDAPIKRTITKQGKKNETIAISIEELFPVDFSKLQALFGPTNSNYLEGKFQDEAHRLANILNLSSQNFNLFHGPGQKTAPKLMVDQLKVGYVKYVYNKPTLPEAANKYTDIEGKGDPKTVYDLVNEYGLPNSPKTEEDRSQWLATWGRYWPKIPTAYSEFYKGELQFRLAAGEQQFTLIKNGELCPMPIREPIKFVMPEFARTTVISDQLNQVVVPCAAQSFRHGITDEENECGAEATQSAHLTNQNTSGNILTKAISFCKKLLENSSKGLAKTLRKVIQVSASRLNPVKIALAAQEKPSCIKLTTPGKKGNAPYCALPADQLASGDSCDNKDDANKLDKDNRNVICRFRIQWTGYFTVPNDFDSCTDKNGNGIYDCTITIKIWPVLRIPWLSEIWNNTLYSNEAEGEPEAGVGSKQVTGRPGIYSFFIPNVIGQSLGQTTDLERLIELQKICADPKHPDFHKLDCRGLIDIWAQSGCDPTMTEEDFSRCLGYAKNKPGEIRQAAKSDPKERFIGATDCSKEFTRDIALKPKALQEVLDVKLNCGQEP